MAQTDTPALSAGSIDDVAARLALWGSRAPKGLARIEFVSDFSRQEVISKLQSTFPQDILLHEVELPFQKPAIEVVHFLRERLRALPAGLVSITGFATAFPDDCPLADSLRVLNFHREALANFPLCQIWWMPHRFAEIFLHTVPDLDSWFMVRLTLAEAITDDLIDITSLKKSDHADHDVDMARKQSAAYIARVETALKTDHTSDTLIYLAFVATSLLGNAQLEQEEKELASELLDRISPFLRERGVLKKRSIMLLPNTKNNASLELDYAGLSENYRMLGQLCECCDRLEEAEAFYNASTDIAEKTIAQHKFIPVGIAFHCFVQFYLRRSRFSEAVILCKRWIDIQTIISEANSYEVVFVFDELQSVYVHTGQFDKAEQICYKMLTISKSSRIADRSMENAVLTLLAQLYKRLGRYAEAEAMPLKLSKA